MDRDVHPIALARISRLRPVVLLLGILLIVTACGVGQGGSSEALKIAVVGPMSGDAEQYGQDFTRGAELAAAKINADGGVAGQPIEIVTFDDRNDTTETANVAQKVGTDRSIDASMGHFTSSTVYAAMPIYQAEQLPLVVISASDPQITQQGNEWLFRVSPTNDLGAWAMADMMVKQLEIEKVAAFYLNTDFGKSEHQYFVERVQANGGEIVFDEAYQPDTKDFSASIIKLKNSGAEAVYLSSYYNDAALLIKQAKAAGVDMDWFASAAVISKTFPEVGGEAVEGVVTTRVARGSSWDAVAEEYKAEYGQEPSPFVIYAYSATQAIVEAATREGATREGIQQGLSQLEDFKTGLGPLTFDENRQAVYPGFDFQVVKDGQFQSWQP